MFLISNLVFDLILGFFPIMLYYFYKAYRNTLDDREGNLVEVVVLISIIYINIRCTKPLLFDVPLIMINMPLILSYFWKNKIGIVVTSFSACIYSYLFYNDFLIIFVIEYFVYYLLFIVFSKKISFNYFVILFSIVKLIFSLLILFVNGEDVYTTYIGVTFLSFVFCLCMLLILFLVYKFDVVLKIHRSVKESISDREVRTSLFRITHEIKNPIAVCKGYLDMFDVNNLEHSKKYIPIMKEEINKTLLLLDDFLSLNRLKLNMDILDINLLLNEVLSNYKLLLKEKGIKLDKNVSDDEVYVSGDYNRLTQVFVNIIKNSVEAFDNGGIIEVCSKVYRGKVFISFKDNGKGMNKEILSKIKEPFFTTKKDGNGLGVSLSFEIIEGHGGKMKYFSKEGEYTLVSINIPITNI